MTNNDPVTVLDHEGDLWAQARGGTYHPVIINGQNHPAYVDGLPGLPIYKISLLIRDEPVEAAPPTKTFNDQLRAAFEAGRARQAYLETGDDYADDFDAWREALAL